MHDDFSVAEWKVKLLLLPSNDLALKFQVAQKLSTIPVALELITNVFFFFFFFFC